MELIFSVTFVTEEGDAVIIMMNTHYLLILSFIFTGIRD
jgi:hypothetical protein